MTRRAEPESTRQRRRRAFTLVELMVVIAVIGLLIAAVALIGRQVIGGQKRAYTETILRGTTAAIDQFRLENPLAGRYDRATERSFGPYPPYQLDRSDVARRVEPDSPASLEVRLRRDLNADRSDRVTIADGTPHDDIRALYAYLSLFTPGALSQIPPDAVKPLPDTAHLPDGEFVRMSGNEAETVPIFGIYDAWGVPLDYMLYAKLEFKVDKYGGSATWRVTDVMPALRSLGVEKELAEAGSVPAGNWIFSEPLPEPVCRAVDADDGSISGSSPTLNGWVRVRAEGDKYPYHGKVD